MYCVAVRWKLWDLPLPNHVLFWLNAVGLGLPLTGQVDLPMIDIVLLIYDHSHVNAVLNIKCI